MNREKKQQLNALEKKRFRRIVLLVLCVVGLLLLFIPGRGLMSYRAMDQQVARLTGDNQRLEERNRVLNEEIERLQHDDAYIEELARKKYGLLKNNETVYEFKSKQRRKD